MEQSFIDVLKRQKETHYPFQDLDKQTLLKELNREIGNKDPEIRDHLVYPNLAHLLHDKHLNASELQAIAEAFLGNDFLLKGIDGDDRLDVLTRSFTVLQLVILVYVHVRDQVFETDFVRRLIPLAIDSFRKEPVLLGYDPEYGWMHAVAHYADLFHQLSRLKEIDAADLERLFDAVLEKFAISHYNFIHDEDERMATALKSAIDRNLLSEEFLKDWVTRFAEATPPTTFPEIYCFKNNRKNLLRSLYFRLIGEENRASLRTVLEASIVRLEKRNV